MSERGKELRMKALVVHLVVYVMVIALLAVINYMFTPPPDGMLWFLFAAIPWGIGVVIHLLITVLWQDGDVRNKTATRQRVFLIHLVIYLLVNAFLAVINLMFSPQIYWFIFPAIGWGIGVVLHLIFAFLWTSEKS